MVNPKNRLDGTSIVLLRHTMVGALGADEDFRDTDGSGQGGGGGLVEVAPGMYLRTTNSLVTVQKVKATIKP